MRRLGEYVTAQYPLGALSTGTFDFYAPLGWERWRGPSYVVGATDGIRTEGGERTVIPVETPLTPGRSEHAARAMSNTGPEIPRHWSYSPVAKSR